MDRERQEEGQAPNEGDGGRCSDVSRVVSISFAAVRTSHSSNVGRGGRDTHHVRPNTVLLQHSPCGWGVED